MLKAVATRGRRELSQLTSSIYGFLLRCIKATIALCKDFRLAVVYAIKGKSAEESKPVFVETWKAALWKLAAHILPVAGTIVISYLNLTGYFIGEDLTGLPVDSVQNFDRLCLQVTAKLFVR